MTRALEPLGIGEDEELLYRYLVERPAATLPTIARSLGIPQRLARARLAELERHGLVSRTAGERSGIVAAPPARAIEALILGRQEQMERVRMAANELDSVFRSSRPVRPAPLDVVEVVLGKDAVSQRFEQLVAIARERFLVLEKPPYATDPLVSDAPLENALLTRGVQNLVIYDHAALSIPGRLAHLQASAEAGEEARTLPELPTKMFIADRSIGFIPLSIDEPGMEGALLVQPSPVLEALVVLFDSLWAQAVPCDFSSGDVAPWSTAPDELRTEDRQVFTLLLAGLKDQAIARHLEVAHRTVLRRVSGLMGSLGAQTRFQAGWLAARRGWGVDGSEQEDA